MKTRRRREGWRQRGLHDLLVPLVRGPLGEPLMAMAAGPSADRLLVSFSDTCGTEALVTDVFGVPPHPVCFAAAEIY